MKQAELYKKNDITKKGMTVIELLVVMLLVSLIASLGLSIGFSSKDRMWLRAQANEIVGKIHQIKQLASTENRSYRFTCTGERVYALYFLNSSTSAWELYKPVTTIKEGMVFGTPLVDFVISSGGFILDPSTSRFSGTQTIKINSAEAGNIQIFVNTSGGINIEENFAY